MPASDVQRGTLKRRIRDKRVAVRRAITPEAVADGRDDAQRRAMLVDYLRMMAWWLGRPPMPELSPRLEQSLRALLAGDSEKQVAARLGVSVHTAHAYVKEIYRRAGVTSRGELMMQFLPRVSTLAQAVGSPEKPPTRIGTL